MKMLDRKSLEDLDDDTYYSVLADFYYNCFLSGLLVGIMLTAMGFLTWISYHCKTFL